VDGLEYSGALVAIAQRNFALLGILRERLAVFCGDAGTYDLLDTYNYFYLSNPFYSPVMKKFIANLVASLAQHDRPVTIIYYVPACHEDIIESNRFKKTAEFPGYEDNKIYIFKSL